MRSADWEIHRDSGTRSPGLGLEVVFRWEFPDHHPYKPVELHRLSSQARRLGAEMLVTTEKDRVNFPVNFVASAAPLDIAWLEIESVLDKEAEFFKWLRICSRITTDARSSSNDGLKRTSASAIRRD